jgi:hypothetical protein
VGEPFWELWGGLIFATVIMSAIVSLTLQLFETGIRELVDTTVQSTLLQRLAESDYQPQPCDKNGPPSKACISVVGIDDTDFRGIFKQQSPLNPDQLLALFNAMLSAPPRLVAIDLDLSPASEEEWTARKRLLASLQALAQVTRLVMVCPQGYSTPEPGPLDQKWVQHFGSEVQFASPDLSVDGLYYDSAAKLKTLGIVSAASAKAPPAQDDKVDWDVHCRSLLNEAAGKPKLSLIRPAPVAVSSFAQALAQPQSLANRIVLVGGKWGINDQFRLRGQTDAFYGVSLHAWVTATELTELRPLPESANLVLDVLIGMLAGGAFVLIWGQIAAHRRRYGMRTFFYMLFFAVAFGLPIAWVLAAAYFAQFGIVLGAAGMILSAAADSFLSAHDTLLEPPDKHQKNSQAPPWWRLAARPLGATLMATLLLLSLFYKGESVCICLACGSLAGVFFGLLDAGQAPPAVPRRYEGLCDLTMRLLWLVAKTAALIWAALNTFDVATGALLLAFMASWFLSYHRLTRNKIANINPS